MEWVYGRNVAALALAAGARRRARRLAATAPALKALRGRLPDGALAGLDVSVLSVHDLDELTGSRDHQGVALQVEPYPYADPSGLLGGGLVVVLDEVSDPRNLGAVARSALAAGAAGIAVPRHRAASVTPAAVKASAGALEHLPVARVTNTVAFLKQAKAAGYWVYGAAGGAEASYLELDFSVPVALVFGAEGRGLRPLVARTCDALAAIPVEPPLESLNVSVAAALFLFEARRQAAARPCVPGKPSDAPGDGRR
jgi:23S rRNA (guanosine2251-2'-O)-methyltransferase